MKFYSIIYFLFSLPIINAIGQETEEIICPMGPSCYILKPSSKIPLLKLESEYFGKVFVETEIDTVALKLINHKLVFVNLRSEIDPLDSLVIRMDNITGNESIIDELRTNIIKHISYLSIKKVCDSGGVVPKYVLPVKIIN